MDLELESYLYDVKGSNAEAVRSLDKYRWDGSWSRESYREKRPAMAPAATTCVLVPYSNPVRESLNVKL